MRQTPQQKLEKIIDELQNLANEIDIINDRYCSYKQVDDVRDHCLLFDTVRGIHNAQSILRVAESNLLWSNYEEYLPDDYFFETIHEQFLREEIEGLKQKGLIDSSNTKEE